jgi:hypothetical protein
MKFLNNLSLNGNELQNFRAQSLSGADPTGYAGRIYFNTTSNRLRYHDGTAWHDMSGDVRSVTNATNGGLNFVDTNGDIVVNVVVDNTTIEINTNALRVKDLGITTAKLANLAVTTGKIADANVTLAKVQNIASNRVLGRVAAGSGVATELELIPSGALGGVTSPSTKLATVQAIIDHVAGVVSAIGTLQGSFIGGSVNFPGTAGTKKGDYWYVTGNGTTQGIILNTGDVIIANKDAPSATLPGDYIFLESNRDQATESIKGVIQLATQAQANAGVDDTTAITPLKLHTWFAQSNIRSYSALIGGATSIGVTHGLGTKDVVVQFYENATDEAIWTDWTTGTTSAITAIFAVAPAAASIRVVVKK